MKNTLIAAVHANVTTAIELINYYSHLNRILSDYLPHDSHVLEAAFRHAARAGLGFLPSRAPGTASAHWEFNPPDDTGPLEKLDVPLHLRLTHTEFSRKHRYRAGLTVFKKIQQFLHRSHQIRRPIWYAMPASTRAVAV